MKKNKIFSFILSLATICNFTLAQAQDNNEKDLKNTIVLVNKDKDVEKYKSFNDNIIYNIFKYKIFLEDIDTKNILGYEEGLENYLKKILNNTNSYTTFLDEAASLRYTKSRIKRFIINCLLGNSSDLNDIDINFIKVLAYNKNAIQFFGEISNKINIIINKKDLAKLDNKNLSIYTKMIDSSNLYNLGIGKEMNYDFIHNNRPIKR